MPFIYLASPYSHPDALVREQRYLYASKVVAQYLRDGVPVYSPIIHGHEIAKVFDLPKDFDFWERHCLAMLEAASAFHVLRIDGWDVSAGIAVELAYAREKGLPIKFI